MAISAAQVEDIEIGLSVMTSDRKEIGRVKEVEGTYFKIDAPMHRDFWLPASLIDTCSENVLLCVSSESLDGHRLSQPGFEVADDPMASIVAEPVIKPSELLEQRARMERELADQSRRLSPEELSVTQMRGARAWEQIPADHTGFGGLAGEYVPNAPVQDRIESDLGRQQFRKRAGGATIAILGMATLALAGAYLVRKRRQQPEHRARRAARSLANRAHDVTERAQAVGHQVEEASERLHLGEHLRGVGERVRAFAPRAA
jgi:hypothetical protein